MVVSCFYFRLNDVKVDQSGLLSSDGLSFDAGNLSFTG